MFGTITYVKKAKQGESRKGSGYGFIKDDDGGERMFMHSAVKGTAFDALRDGLRVEFSPAVDPTRPAPKNLRADDVRVISR